MSTALIHSQALYNLELYKRFAELDRFHPRRAEAHQAYRDGVTELYDLRRAAIDPMQRYRKRNGPTKSAYRYAALRGWRAIVQTKTMRTRFISYDYFLDTITKSGYSYEALDNMILIVKDNLNRAVKCGRKDVVEGLNRLISELYEFYEIELHRV